MIAHDDAVRPSDRPGGFDQENNRPTDGAWSKVGDNRCAWKKVSIPMILTLVLHLTILFLEHF